MSEQKGLQTTPNEGQVISVEVDGIKYSRLPIKTRLALIDEDFDAFIKEYTKDISLNPKDILTISTKIISIMRGYYVKESDIKVSWLAKFLVRFVKKWPNDKGYAVPAKIQLAMNIVGMPRFIFAMIVGGALKYLGKPGYFYRIAGHNINGIDGFIPEQYPEPLRGYGFLFPDDPDMEAQRIEDQIGIAAALMDGNNVENHVIGMSKKLKDRFSKEKFLEIMQGNPQGQEGMTPLVLVRSSL